TATGVGTSASFSETNTADAVKSIVVISGSGQSATVHTTFVTNTLVAKVIDQYGNPESGVSVTFADPATGASAILGGPNTVTTGANGLASDTITPNNVAGSYAITAT